MNLFLNLNQNYIYIYYFYTFYLIRILFFAFNNFFLFLLIKIISPPLVKIYFAISNPNPVPPPKIITFLFRYL